MRYSIESYRIEARNRLLPVVPPIVPVLLLITSHCYFAFICVPRKLFISPYIPTFVFTCIQRKLSEKESGCVFREKISNIDNYLVPGIKRFQRKNELILQGMTTDHLPPLHNNGYKWRRTV